MYFLLALIQILNLIDRFFNLFFYTEQTFLDL